MLQEYNLERSATKPMGVVMGGMLSVTLFVLASYIYAANIIPTWRLFKLTPIEVNAYTRLPSSAEIANFLGELAADSQLATLVPLGQSAGKRPLQALLISTDPAFLRHGRSEEEKLTVLLVGSQHGTEPSGAEALQRVARELIDGSLRPYLQAMHFVLLVNGNPDGRDTHQRVNAHGVNLSTDYVLLSQSESQAAAALLRRFLPHVVLDVHESALLKRRSLGAQGFLTDFEAQFEIANHPNVPSALQAFSRERFLPALIKRVTIQGLPARHYIGEITDVNQPITHGGLSLRTLRNYAGMHGALSMLVENRLDPPGQYPTPRNLDVRIAKQVRSITAFLAQCQQERAAILAHVAAARRSLQEQETAPPLYLTATYVRDPLQPWISLPLRRRDTGELVPWTFAYHRRVVAGEPLAMPSVYVVTAHEERIAALLNRHAICYTRRLQPGQMYGIRQRIDTTHRTPKPRGRSPLTARVRERAEMIQLTPGDLEIPLGSLTTRLVPLLLDPRSSSSIFQHQAAEDLLVAGMDFFVVRGDPKSVEEARGPLSPSSEGPKQKACENPSRQ